VYQLDESKKLLEKAYEKLDSAKLLFENKFYADCVSRAYYCMIFAARSLLALKKIHPKSHQSVIRILGLEFVTKGYLDEISGRAIATAKEDREDADYGIGINITKEEAERVLNDAEEFITKVVDAQKILKKELKKQKKL
jgi:uncharacterized protein (UPF0332 family)